MTIPWRLDEGTLSWFGHRWDYETWTSDTWRIWSREHAEDNEWSPEWGGEG